MNTFVPTALAAALCSAVFAASAAVPVITDGVSRGAALIHADPAMQALLAEATSEEAQKWRFNTLLELARIASPSRFEMRRQAEITRRLVEEWGFAPEDVLTRPDGFLKGAGVQTVDGKPVYNVCVRIPGTYGARPDAVSYKGQLPKVVLEGHIDTVNPAVLPPAETPYEAVKLQKVNEPIVKTRDELKALPLEVHFDKNGKVIEDEIWQKAYKRYQNIEDARKKDGYRIYVPGYNDAMINTVAVMQVAKLMKKHNIRPVYDIWVCGTTGEEGKGNLCGMKQLYGYNQDVGKGNNALNIVANFGADSTKPGSAIVNYLGSYRFEIKYTEPAGWKAGEARPSAAMAMSRAVAAISDLKKPWDADKSAERTTYTVGVAKCEGPKARSTACTLMVDMRVRRKGRSPPSAPGSSLNSRRPWMPKTPGTASRPATRMPSRWNSSGSATVPPTSVRTTTTSPCRRSGRPRRLQASTSSTRFPNARPRSMTTSPPQSACRPSTPTSARTPAVAAATPGTNGASRATASMKASASTASS